MGSEGLSYMDRLAFLDLLGGGVMEVQDMEHRGILRT